MTYKIYCVEGPDESCLFDDPEKGYEESDEVTEELPITNPDDEDDDLENEPEDDEDSDDLIEDEEI
jgi:hypothetical protein